MEITLSEKDVPKITVNEVAERMDRNRHTAWHHIKKHGFGRMVGKMILLTENEVILLLNVARKHNI